MKALELGPRGLPRRRLTKQQAVRHLIHAAVRMVLAGEDPFAAHLLIQSADKLLIDLAAHSRPKQLAMDWAKLIKPEYKDALIKVFRETYNFLKHADRDHDETLHVGDIATSNLLQLAACIANYRAIFDEITDHMKVGFALAGLVFPDGFVSDDHRHAFDQAAAGYRGLSPRQFISDLHSSGLADVVYSGLAAERADDLQDVTPFLDQPFEKI
ncbi:hypothetical protein ABIA85_006648 [Bradyrhizobium sp. LA6.10]|uniref:hypothetical protein n=1 Tax=Bradyrhizobium sp. LA6.10 TaxID=3156318 RepID=UPI00339ABCC8